MEEKSTDPHSSLCKSLIELSQILTTCSVAVPTYNKQVYLGERVWCYGAVQDSGLSSSTASANMFVSLSKILSLNCFVDLSVIR